jgi:hypothetical protein
MGRRIGYARVSTADQKLKVQKTALERDGCTIVFEEKRTGTRCLSPLNLCHLLVSSWGGWHGPEAAFGRRHPEAFT